MLRTKQRCFSLCICLNAPSRIFLCNTCIFPKAISTLISRDAFVRRLNGLNWSPCFACFPPCRPSLGLSLRPSHRLPLRPQFRLTRLMKRFTTKFSKAEDQLTEKQIRSFFCRLRKKIKTRVNEETSQKIIDDKVREEVVKELVKIKEKFASTMDTDQTNSSPGETKEVSRKRPGSQRSRRKVKRVRSTVRRRPARRRPVRRSRQRPRGRTSRRRVSCTRRRRSRSYSTMGRK